jgi:hypothetical protein
MSMSLILVRGESCSPFRTTQIDEYPSKYSESVEVCTASNYKGSKTKPTKPWKMKMTSLLELEEKISFSEFLK